MDVSNIMESVAPSKVNAARLARQSNVQYKMEGYDTSQSGKKSSRGWLTSPNSPMADVSSKLSIAHGDSRDLTYNTPLINAMIGRCITNVLGPGLIPQSMPDWKFLGITKEKAKEIADSLERRFDIWASSSRCDAHGQRNFYDLQAVALRSALTSGDIFASFPWMKAARVGNWEWECCVALTEADLVRDPEDHNGNYDNKDIINGIEYLAGRMTAVHVHKSYPGANHTSPYDYELETSKRVPIYAPNGRQNVYHIMLPFGRPGQRRSMPWVTPIIDMLKSVSTHTDAEIQAAVVTSLFTVFLRDANNTGLGLNESYKPVENLNFGGGGTDVDSDDKQTPLQKDTDRELEINMGPGSVYELPEGTDISVADPRRANSLYSDFHRSMVTEMCASLGIPYSQVMMAFDSSYTASKAELQEGEKEFKKFRLWFVRNFVQAAWENFIEEEVHRGHIDLPGFNDDISTKMAYTRAHWIGPANGLINPQQEAKASVIKIQNHLSTRGREMTGATGERWDQEMEKYAEEEQLLDDLGINVIELVDDAEETNGPTGKDPVKPGGQTWGKDEKIDIYAEDKDEYESQT